MIETEIRYLIYTIENPQRLVQAGRNYPVNQALKTIPKKSVFGKVLFRLGSWLIDLGTALERLSGQFPPADTKPASSTHWQRQHS